MKKVIVFGLVFTLALTSTLSVQADKLSQYKDEKSSINRKLNEINKDKKEIKERIESKEDKKKELANVQNQREKEYRKLQGEVNNLEEMANALEQELKRAEEEYDEKKELVKTRLRIMYENSSSSYLEILVESKSLLDFYERVKMLSLIAKNDNQLLDELETARADVEQKKRDKEELKAQVAEKAKEKAEAIKQIKVSRANVDQEIKRYELSLDELEKKEDEYTRRFEQLNREIVKLMSSRQYDGGTMKWPCPSTHRITSYYGMRFHPILKKTKLHTGIDIGAASGSSIVAAAKGTVIVAGWGGGYGNTIVIDHGGKIATRYAHCSRLLVKVGQEVSAGEVIGKVGSTGWSTGPHLHFEVIKNGATVNPLGGYIK